MTPKVPEVHVRVSSLAFGFPHPAHALETFKNNSRFSSLLTSLSQPKLLEIVPSARGVPEGDTPG